MTTLLDGVSPTGPAASTPDPHPDVPAFPTKRKHDDISTDAIVNGENTSNDRIDAKDLHNSLRDIWQVINAQNIVPDILRSIGSYEVDNEPTGDEPSSKRAKLSPASEDSTIASKIARGGFESYDQFLLNVSKACSDILKPAEATNGSTQQLSWVDSPEDERRQATVSAIVKYLSNLVQREKQRLAVKVASEPHVAKLEHDQDSKPNGTGAPDVSPALPIGTQPSPRTVLTIFGNAQGHRQLFSSLQKPSPKATISGLSQDNIDASGRGFVPIRESGLPVGLNSTKIVPAPVDPTTQNAKPRRTLQEIFTPPSSTRPLAPPKTPKLVASRDSTITWSKAHIAEPNPRNSGYTDEKLTTGAWLGYGGLAPAEEPTSPQAKRKQRDRALSTGEACLTPSRGVKAAQLQVQEEALFRSAYSSFAPSRDNSTALVPEETRNEMWWEKYGTKYFSEAFAIDPSLGLNEEEADAEEEPRDKETLFREAVENFTPAQSGSVKPSSSAEDREGEEMLLEVSQMLETLHSYQRIRMSSLAANSRTSLVQNSPLQELTGSPSTPSIAEVETYKTLKAQLALIVSMLPPFAVAKLNGDQLADLNISREVPIEVEEYRGVMEEDKASREAKHAAFQAAVGAASATNRQTPVHPSGQHQPRGAQIPQSARGHHQNPAQYANSPQLMPRGQPQFSRQPLSSWQKPSQNYTQRPSYANPQPQNYNNQQAQRNMNQNIRPSYPQMAQPRPGNLQQLPNGSPQSNPQYSYQQRMQGQGSPTYVPNGAYAPSPSPSKITPRPQQAQMNYQGQNQQQPQQVQVQQQYAHPASPSQQSPQMRPPSRDQQQGGSQTPLNPLQASQSGMLPPGLSASPMPRPLSSAGEVPPNENSGTHVQVNGNLGENESVNRNADRNEGANVNATGFGGESGQVKVDGSASANGVSGVAGNHHADPVGQKLGEADKHDDMDELAVESTSSNPATPAAAEPLQQPPTKVTPAMEETQASQDEPPEASVSETIEEDQA